jgi:hypothetical protein
MYCKDCQFADFNLSRSQVVGYGYCKRLIALTIDNPVTEEFELAAVEKQPLAFHHSTCEIGTTSTEIVIHPNFGCVEFRNI